MGEGSLQQHRSEPLEERLVGLGWRGADAAAVSLGVSAGSRGLVAFWRTRMSDFHFHGAPEQGCPGVGMWLSPCRREVDSEPAPPPSSLAAQGRALAVSDIVS